MSVYHQNVYFSSQAADSREARVGMGGQCPQSKNFLALARPLNILNFVKKKAEKINIKQPVSEADPEEGEGGSTRSDFKLLKFLKIEINGFCLTTSLNKSNFHANHTHHAHHAQNWSVEPLSDFRLDPPLYIAREPIRR